MYSACPELPTVEHGEFVCEPFEYEDGLTGQILCTVQCDEFNGYARSFDSVFAITCGPDTGPSSSEFAWFDAESDSSNAIINNIIATCDRKLYLST